MSYDLQHPQLAVVRRLDRIGGLMLTTIVSFARGVMLRHPAAVLIFILTLAAALALGVEQHRLRDERAQITALALAAGNLQAERDSTRDVAKANAGVAALLGDSVRIVERRAVQIAQTRDELDRALGGERKARVALAVVVDSLERVVPAATASTTGTPGTTGTSGTAATATATTTGSGLSVRHAKFALREAPYTVNAEVEVPDPPDTARLTVKVALDPIPISARVMCAVPDRYGIRSASLVATSPPWANVRLDRVEQSPDVCASPALAPRLALSAARAAPARIAFQRIVVGVGVVGRPAGGISVGWFVGTGFAIAL